MKCFNVEDGKASLGLPLIDLVGINFGNRLVPFHKSLLERGGECCFGYSLVNADLQPGRKEFGHDFVLVPPTDNDSALVRLEYWEASAGVTNNASSVTTAEWNATGDTQHLFSGAKSSMCGGGLDYWFIGTRVCALRINKGAKMELKLTTTSTSKRRFREPLVEVSVRTITYSYDGETVTVEETSTQK